ncbi:MAG: rhamnose/proton symporter RhaT [Kiritimatiellae bacterium]|nr:rhamnose/proton symporter RhaT [Kiritimatiellia bacterium]
MNPVAGSLVFALGGLAGAVFALPFRGIKGVKYESYWLLYALAGLLLFPLALALATCPHAFAVLGEVPASTLAQCALFGALWGLGGLTWGLMIRYLGIGLGLAIGCGLCSATGTLIPPIVTGHAADLVATPGARLALGGVVGSLAGIALVGLAGMFKEGELSEEAKKKSVAEFDFRKGMLVALFSGIASAGMNFGLQSGGALEKAAAAHGTPAAWCGMPVLMVVLWGGLAVNVAWCLWQNAKNKSAGDYATMARKPLFAALACLAGVIWACQFACQKAGEPMMGDLKYIAFAVVMASSIFFSTLLGVALGEWKGTGARTKGCLALGVVVLVASFAAISLGGK